MGSARAGLDRRPADVAAMFDQVAPRYDLMNSLLSAGLDRGWRRAVTAAVAPKPTELVLDVAAGTAVSTAALATTGARVVGCDFSLGMLRTGAAAGRPGISLIAGDALRLPFGSAAFDAVTISFGLRNVADPAAGLAELARVTRPGGRLVVCEFSHPTWPPFRRLYLEYLMRALPAVAGRVSSDPAAYDYLGESIRAWPDQERLAGQIGAAGWSAVRYRNLTGGIVALHHAVRS